MAACVFALVMEVACSAVKMLTAIPTIRQRRSDAWLWPKSVSHNLTEQTNNIQKTSVLSLSLSDLSRIVTEAKQDVARECFLRATVDLDDHM